MTNPNEKIAKTLALILVEHSLDYTAGQATLIEVLDSCGLAPYIRDTEGLGKRIDDMHALSDTIDALTVSAALDILDEYIN